MSEQIAEFIEVDTQTEAEGADEGVLQVTSTLRSVSPDKNDRSLTELHRWFQKGRLIVDPEWQREYVWDRSRASKLIESFFIDLPIPVVYLAANTSGNYEVIDGLQRLTSVFEFFEGKYKLAGLEIRADLNGKYFKDLNGTFQTKLEDSTLRTFELPASTDKDLMFLIFERLNTGGIALNEMEIRNCLYRGGLNTLIKKLSIEESFLAAVNQKNISKRMLDRSLVLRFLAFYQMTYLKARKGLKGFLNDFFDTYRNPAPAKLAEFEEHFKKALTISVTVFGENAFKLRFFKKDKLNGEWGSRVNAAIFQVITVSFTIYDTGALTRAADAILEEYLDLLATDTRWVECVSRSTGDSTRIEYAFETWNNRLKTLMASHPANDTQRGFSKLLKKELWEQDRTCLICKNDIKLLSDAALDHVQHYWRGGMTVPENARLVHRYCNLARAN